MDFFSFLFNIFLFQLFLLKSLVLSFLRDLLRFFLYIVLIRVGCSVVFPVDLLLDSSLKLLRRLVERAL